MQMLMKNRKSTNSGLTAWSLPTVVPYIANYLRWKSFAVAELYCNLLENICDWLFLSD